MKKTRAQLWDEKRDLFKRMNDIQDAASERGEARNAAEETEYDAHAARIQAIEAIMRQEDEHAERSRSLTDPNRTRDLTDPEEAAETSALRSKAYGRAFDRFMRFGDRGLTAEHQDALRAGIDGDVQQRTLSALTGSAGGYLIPPTFLSTINETKKFYGGALAAGIEVLNTAGGEDIFYPTNDDTASVGELIAEGGAVSTGDVSFGQRKLSAYMASSKMVKVPLQLLADESFGLEGFLGRRFGERLGRLANQLFTTGTGASQPQGMATGASNGKTAASATAITSTELIDLEHSVDPAYRDPSRCKYMWNDATLAKLRKLTDGAGRPLWEPSLKEGVPSTLNGYQYIVNNDMPASTAGLKAILFGDFSEFYIARFAGGIVTFRLAELYVANLQQGFFAIERFDGGIKNTSAVKALTMA